MKTQKWNLMESAILLDNYLKILNGAMSRREAIKLTSNELRQLALKQGIEIDDIFRNISGITFQMHSMESAYYGYTIMKPASKLFVETVNLYKNNNEEFSCLLSKARDVIRTPKDNEETFLFWLKDKVSPAQLSELYLAYTIIDEFCMKKNIISESVLKITDLMQINLVEDIIEHNRIFKFENRKDLKKIYSAMKYYILFLKEKTNVQSKEEFTKTNKFSNLINSRLVEGSEKVKEIDFDNIDDLSYTKPIYASYFEETIAEIVSWKQLYVGIFKKIYEDYGSLIPLNKPFNGVNNRMDFCSGEFFFSMEAPIQIDTNRYLETNLSATDIVRKIKMLLDICNINEENLFIRYEKKMNEQASNNGGVKKRIINDDESELFFEWLRDKQGMAQPTCRSYVSAVNTAQRYALDNGFNHHKLYATDYSEALATAKELFGNRKFVKYNEQQHNRFKASIKKLLQFIEEQRGEFEEQNDYDDLQPYKNILLEKFSKGYRIGSPIELRRFKRFWEERYDDSLEADDDSIIEKIKLCGVIHEEKLYMPEIMLDDETKTKLFSYIRSNFSSGKQVIYFEALFNEFSNDFLGHTIYNSNMLRAYLAYMNVDNEFYVDKNFISKESGISSDPYDEVKNCLIQQAIPMEYEQIFQILSHIPEQKIKTILTTNAEFISNGRSEYFHFSAALISDDELEDISRIICQEIENKHFISGNELIDFIKKKYPYFIEKNAMLSDKGLRGVIAYKLNETYSFKGNIISKKGQNLSMKEVFGNFCKKKESFTLDELKVLKQELKTVIYFETVYENSLRISKTQFVSKRYANFIPDETDKAIDRFCPNDYIPISKVSYFGTFPYAGFQWNSFLLEHYVAMYSPNYKLIHLNYNENICVGAIVKKTSNISSMDDLIIDVLARNKLPLQKEQSLNYLCEEGYLGRRTYTNIEQLLIKAKELRNQKGL